MKTLKRYFRLTLIISILVAIMLPLFMSRKPIDWDWFFLVMALSFSLVWAVYSMIFLGYVFLVEGRRNRNRLNDVDPFPPELIQEWETLWEITVKKSDQEEKKILWN